MKRFVLSALSLALLAGCSSAPSAAAPSASSESETVSVPEGLKILSPSGAPSYALVPLAKDGNQELTIVDGADALQAAFVNPDSEYDVIIAPTNLGAKLISADKTNYSLVSVVTTGNLFIVGEEGALDSDGEIALFGENAVPGLIYKKVCTDITNPATWYSSVTEAQAALLAGNASAALLAEPAATATITKAKKDGKTLVKLADLQELWGEDGYPMASMFVRNDVLESNAQGIKALVNELMDYADKVNAGDEDISADLDSLSDPSMFGATPSAMVKAAYAGMGIHVDLAENNKENVENFLNLFSISLTDSTIYSFN